MNDPGLDSPISEEAKALENEKKSGERDEAEDNEQAFLAPSRWWFASTAFPLIAGTFGPMASAFSICALAIHWRVSVPPGTLETYGTYVEDPLWLIGVNAAQLAIALISNLFLLLNMAESVRFSIAQPITIVGWYISSFAMIGLLAGAAGPLLRSSGPDVVLSQAFYYAVFAAGLYFICATLMLITVIGAYLGHFAKEFKLTMSQRTLMLQTISFLVYLILGSVVYSHIEGWFFLDALYWADYTLLTIGIGDIAPTTDLGRGLLFPFAIGGIIILGLVIGSIRSLVLERGKVKLGARMLEKERERFIKKIHKKKARLLFPINDGKIENSEDPELDGLTERERRLREFNLMRKVQDSAASKRRWISLWISAATWFFLWFAGAAVFHAAETDTQQWDYYQGLYFAYTSLLTIGYGDIYPVSNAGKPFFVFWSLLAIPSLTILISNMGDTIVKGIRDVTLWIGTITVLPSENGLRSGIKIALRKITKGKALRGVMKENAPGILGELGVKGKNVDDDEETGGSRDHHRKNDPEGGAQRVASNQAHIEGKKAREEGKTDDERAIPKSKRHYHTILIKEISSVMRHLNSSPPRKYSFDEWAWYLKLVGEDESSPETHRPAIRKVDRTSTGLGNATGRKMDKDQTVKWSWVGNRSPLMGNEEEAEWVLQRLTKTLERELEAMRREEEEGKRDWAPGGKKEGKEAAHGGNANSNGHGRAGEKEGKGPVKEEARGQDAENFEHRGGPEDETQGDEQKKSQEQSREDGEVIGREEHKERKDQERKAAPEPSEDKDQSPDHDDQAAKEKQRDGEDS